MIDRIRKFLYTNFTFPKRIEIRARYIVPIDAVGIFLVFLLNLYIRFESIPIALQYFVSVYPFVVIEIPVRIFLKLVYRMYSHLWEHASVGEIFRIIWVSTFRYPGNDRNQLFSVPLAWYILREFKGDLFLGWVLNVVYLGGSRLVLRYLINWLSARHKRMLVPFTKRRNVFIFGAGSVGAIVQRMLEQNPEMGLVNVGFIDDDPAKLSANLLGVPVIGSRNNINDLVKRFAVTEVIVAMPTAKQEAIDAICRICSEAGVSTRVIPSLYDLLSGTLTVDQLRQWRPVEALNDTVLSSNDSTTDYHCLMVTGGAGFIGSNFVRYMLKTYPDYRIVVFDKLTYAGNLDNLLDVKQQYPDRYEFVKGDIANYHDVSKAIEAYGIDVIVNFAAETHVDRSLLQPESFLNTNIYGTYTLLEAARKYSIKRFHQVSTDEVYGQVFRGSFSEQDPLDTRSPYSASKASSDLLAISYNVSFGVPVTITRGSNNIGPYQYPEKAVPLFITNAIENQPLPLYGDGLYVRDYQFVIDHCRGIDYVLHRGVVGEVYNVGGGNEVAAIDLARLILKKLGKPESLIQLVTDRAGQDRRYSLNCSKIKSLGWQTDWDFERSLDETIQWYVANEWWWRKLKSGEYREYYEKQYRQRLENAVIAALSDEP